MIYGDYREPNAAGADRSRRSRRGELDVAAVWGPIGGYFAKHAVGARSRRCRSPIRRALPLCASSLGIAMGVRKGEHAFRDELNRILERRREDIHRLLDAYGVPQVQDAGAGAASAPGRRGRAGTRRNGLSTPAASQRAAVADWCNHRIQ